MPHLKQIPGGELADQPMIRRDGGQTHSRVAAVNHHAGFRQIRRQIVNMRIVDTQ
jgi:hypothetical protein